MTSSSASESSCRIALLDSGIEWSLPVFRGAAIAGRDFIASGCLSDPTGHGTGNASVLVAQRDGTRIGLAPQSSLLIGKVLGRADRGRTERAITAGIGWATAEGADIIVLPFGSARGSRSIGGAIRRAVEAGCQVFAAAGNRCGEEVSFPARLPGVFAVSVIGTDGRPDRAYCTADGVDVYAPGRDIPAVGTDGPTLLNGSSVAAVVAAGVAAGGSISTWLSPDSERR